MSARALRTPLGNKPLPVTSHIYIMRANKLETAVCSMPFCSGPPDFLNVILLHLTVLTRPISVAERLICHAIIGKNPHKERIMTVDVSANFIAPLTELSTREISFTTYQVPARLYIHTHVA